MSKHLADVEADYRIWQALPGSQKIFLSCPIFEALLSGTRGGGKTDTLLMDFLQHVGQGWGAEWRGILFRTKFRDLNDVITKSLKWFPKVYPTAAFNWSKCEWTFPQGEKLLFRHIRKASDYESYHGHAYPWIAFEELTNWPNDVVYKLMMSCCRSTVIGMPRKFRATTNPYGIGHGWVKERFKLPGMAHTVIRETGKPERVAIMSYLQENVHLLRAEPDYIERIREAARNHAEEKAWLLGSWDIVSGGMLDDVWNPRVHLIAPFPIPRTWRIDRSFDWGSSKPFSVGWWAESDGSTVETPTGTRHTVKGDLFRIYESYGWTGEANTGRRMLAHDIAAGIVEREIKWGIRDLVVPGPADS
ncbi:MAG: phage terminase large subunit, partial [Geminicoccaceae bacterium]